VNIFSVIFANIYFSLLECHPNLYKQNCIPSTPRFNIVHKVSSTVVKHYKQEIRINFDWNLWIYLCE